MATMKQKHCHESFRERCRGSKSTSTKASVKNSINATSTASTDKISGHPVDTSMTAAPTQPWTSTSSREASREGMEASTETLVNVYFPESSHGISWHVHAQTMIRLPPALTQRARKLQGVKGNQYNCQPHMESVENPAENNKGFHLQINKQAGGRAKRIPGTYALQIAVKLQRKH